MVRRLFLVLVAVLVPFAAACGNEKKDALEGLEKIKAACSANEKDLAKKLAEDLKGQNKIFEKAFDAAIDDKRGSYNICSPTLHSEINVRIEHGS
jgi:hypothetical protein